MMPSSMTTFDTESSTADKGKLLVLGGTGFLGQAVCQRALLEGYQVTSLSRRGLPPDNQKLSATRIDYRQGDARKKDSIANILLDSTGDGDAYVGIIHCVGLLFDDSSGLGSYNRFVSGSGSLPDSASTYDTITRLTAFNAMEVATEYCQKKQKKAFPFVFTSAAEAGWPDVAGGELIEKFLAPDFLKRYLAAKRAVEAKLLASQEDDNVYLRPIIFRPSLIYSLDRPASFASVGAFFVGNKVGLPFIDRPVTVQSLAAAMVRAIGKESVQGILRYPDIDELAS